MKPFHYAFKIKDIPSTRAFYINMLGCTEGRSTETWIDFDFFGHQLSAHISENILPLDYCGKVDGIMVPIPHFGVVLDLEKFKEIETILLNNKIEFIVPPNVRYANMPGEQWTMFILDPSQNPIEFKAYKNIEEMFL